jgi:hypothetical protein
MANFLELVSQAFSPLVEKYHFVWAVKSAKDKFVALVARQCIDVCYYIFVREHPTGGVSGCLWVAPPDAPSDALARLLIGFRVDLGESHQDPSKFIFALAERAETLLPGLSGLVEATKREIADPPIQSLRLTSYLASRAAYKAIEQYCATTQGSYCSSLFTKAKEVADHRADWDDLEAEAERIAKRLLRDKYAPIEIQHGHFRNDAHMLGQCLVAPLYIEALVPSPRPG